MCHRAMDTHVTSYEVQLGRCLVPGEAGVARNPAPRVYSKAVITLKPHSLDFILAFLGPASCPADDGSGCGDCSINLEAISGEGQAASFLDKHMLCSQVSDPLLRVN